MNRTISDLNIKHIKMRLESETAPEKRQILLRLLAEEEAKLNSANAISENRPAR